ncbi:MAG: hypothetical protein K8L91_08100 [Anaerolineae bacterium]|nr:hypothetical protein [Anaerolineae bacterium]
MNKLSTQVVAFLVLTVVTLVGVLIVTNSDIDTDVKTADASLLELTTNDSSIDFSISYPNEWQAAPTADGAGYVFTLKEPRDGVAEEMQPQIEITLLNSPYADTLVSAQTDLGADSLDAYETVDSHRSGVRYATTNSLDNGQQVATDIIVLDPQDQSVTSEVEENRTLIARLTADANKIGEYRQTLDLMLTSVKVAEPFRVPQLAQTITNPTSGITVNYPDGWTASVDAAPNDTITRIVAPDEADGLLRLAYVPLLDQATGTPITLADLESQILGGVDPNSFIQPMALYSAGGYTGDAGAVVVPDNGSGSGDSVIYVVFLQLSDADAVVALAQAGPNDIAGLQQVTDAVLQTLQFVPPTTPEATEIPETEPTESATEVPTEEATPAAEETATAEPTEVPTEVPTEAPTTEATPAN